MVRAAANHVIAYAASRATQSMANANAQQATPEVGAMKVIIFNTAIY
jgi:hypothetical protein